MIWHSFKPVVWIFLLGSAVLLGLWVLVSQDLTKMIIPPPEKTAEQLVAALGAHRYQGAMNLLSRDLQQEVEAGELQALVRDIEQSLAKGIQEARGQEAREQGAQAAAVVQVKLGNNRQTTVEILLVKENGVWRITSLDPLRELVEQ